MTSDPDQSSPDRLLDTFSRSRMRTAWIASAALHLFAILSTSVGYIYNTAIDPEGAAARAAAAQATPPPADPGTAASPVPTTPASSPEPASATPSAEATATPASDAATLEERKNTPMGRSLTESLDPDSLKLEPGEEGIPLQNR